LGLVHDEGDGTKRGKYLPGCISALSSMCVCVCVCVCVYIYDETWIYLGQIKGSTPGVWLTMLQSAKCGASSPPLSPWVLPSMSQDSNPLSSCSNNRNSLLPAKF
jgi:hypothetical protein